MLTFQLYFGLVFILFTITFWDSYDNNSTLSAILSCIGMLSTLFFIEYLQSIHFFVK